MINSIMFALFFAGAIAAPHKSGLIYPKEDIATNSQDFLAPNPESCYSFIHNINGTPTVMFCAPANPPLEWNDIKKECDYPPSPTCVRVPGAVPPPEMPTEVLTDGQTSTQTPIQTPTETPTQTTRETPTNEPKGAAKDETTEASTQTPTQTPIGTKTLLKTAPGFVCPVEDITATGCKGPKDCVYPNPESPNNFIQCTFNANGICGTPVVMPCAPANRPLEWNDDKKQGDYAPSPH